MKLIIFAGIGLFAAATIYGITDYAADKKKGTIDKLYKEEPAAAAVEEKETTAVPVATAEKDAGTPAAANNTAAAKNTFKKKVKKYKTAEVREFKFSEFSRGRIPRKLVKVEVPAEPVIEVTEPVKQEQ